MTQEELGVLGEIMAQKHLTNNSYEILDLNWRFHRYELDIVARIKNWIVFVEVKTRENSYAGEPWEAVNRQKQNRIIMAANEYLILKDIELDCRFDIISIVHNSKYSHLEHLEDAFYPLSR